MNKKNKGFTLVELLVVIGILGILMGALFPAISSAMLSAQTSALAMNGQNLYKGIFQANTDRAGAYDTVWPKCNTSAATQSDDIASQQFSDADKYFDELFDMQNYGTTDYRPYVNVDIKFLSGGGVPTYKGNKTLKGCIAWKVVADLTDDMPDVIPVLVSRNLSTDNFATEGTVDTLAKTKPEKADSRFPAPFGKKASVTIYKSGAAKVHKDRYQSIADIYDRQTVAFSDGQKLTYLVPSSGN